MKRSHPSWPVSVLRHLRWFAASLALAAAVGCGGVGEEGTGIRTESANVGALTLASDDAIVVNGVEYRRKAATVTDARGEPVPDADLRIGMWVEVQGTAGLDGSDAEAERIRVRAAARGEVKSVARDGTLTVLDSPVALTADTVRDGGADPAAIAPGDLVEVHGPLGAAPGSVIATRVERVPTNPAAPIRYELRGRVTQLDATQKTMTVGARQVDYGSARVALGIGLNNRQVVRVSSSTAPVDGVPWRIDDLRSDASLPANLGFLYTEGFVEQWEAGPLFQLEDLAVDASGANGKGDVTGDGLQVAVFGARVNGTLRAKAVALVRPDEPVVFTLIGPITAYTSTSSFRVRGVPVDASTAAFTGTADPSALGNTVRVRVQGTVQGRGLKLTTVTILP